MSKLKVLKPTAKTVPLLDPQWKSRRFGVVDKDDNQIFIHESILKEINAYSRTDLDHEVGGVLVGGYHVDGPRTFVEIYAYIPSRLGRSRTTSFTFTLESWHEVLKEKDAKYPDSILVGWHHTHPRFGIFLSSMDEFIHQGYFDLPWMVALVVDPIAEKLGFFQWKQKRIVSCGFHTIARA